MCVQSQKRDSHGAWVPDLHVPRAGRADAQMQIGVVLDEGKERQAVMLILGSRCLLPAVRPQEHTHTCTCKHTHTHKQLALATRGH
eukprot:1138308-Pelagomonas_calceolata.AAC.1